MRRLRLRTILIAVLIALVPIAAHRLWDYIELRRLISEFEAVLAKGEPVTESQGLARWSFQAWSSHAADAGAYYIAGGMIAPALSRSNRSTDSLRDWLAGAVPEASAETLERLRALVGESSDALALADKAAGLQYSTLPPGTEYNYRDSHVLLLARLVAARTLALSWSGDGDAAVSSALSALKLRRPLTELRWWFARAADHETAAILSLSRPSPSALVSLQSALHAEDARDRVLDGLLLDRARAIEGFWKKHYGPDPQVPGDYRLPMRSVMQTARRPLVTRRAVRTMRTWAELVDVARKPWPQRIDAVDALIRRNSRPGSASSDGMSLSELPTLGLSTPRIAVIAVLDRTAITAIAIERFRRDNDGAVPGALAELVPRYLTAVPEDPYSGQPLLLARGQTSYTVYSVGPDRRDDRGDLISEHLAAQKRGYGQRPLRGRDAGIRVSLSTPAPAPVRSR